MIDIDIRRGDALTLDRSEPRPPADVLVADEGPEQEVRPTEVGKKSRTGLRRIDVGLLAALVLLAGVITTLGVYRATTLSAYDESTHIDYAWALAHGNLPFAGSTLAPEVLEAWSCRGQDNAVGALPACGENAEANQYPARGENYNFAHPPTYYAATAAVTRVVDVLPVDLSFVTVARMTGAAWLAMGLIGMYLVMRMWRVSRFFAFAGAAVIASVPSIAHASSIVTNDAPAILCGVLALWVLSRVVLQEKHGWLLPTALAAFVASTKVMNSIAMLAVAGVVLFLAVTAARSGDRAKAIRLGAISAGIVGATGAVFVAWTAFQKTRGMPGWISPIQGANTDPVLGNPIGEWLPTLFSTFGIAQTFWLQATLTSFTIVALARWLTVVLAAAPFLNVVGFVARDTRRLVGWAALLGTAAVPLIVQVQTYLGDRYYFPNVSSRYGITLLPLTLAALVLVAQARNWKAAAALLAGASVCALLLGFTGVF